MDYSKYEGHTPAEKWEYRRLSDNLGKSYSTLYEAHVSLGPCMIWCPEGHTEQEANARLIADAPMLLERCKRLEEALTKFVAWHDMDHDSMKGWEVQEAYDKAIRAAVQVLKEQGQ